jgi:hypothetical protein
VFWAEFEQTFGLSWVCKLWQKQDCVLQGSFRSLTGSDRKWTGLSKNSIGSLYRDKPKINKQNRSLEDRESRAQWDPGSLEFYLLDSMLAARKDVTLGWYQWSVYVMRRHRNIWEWRPVSKRAWTGFLSSGSVAPPFGTPANFMNKNSQNLGQARWLIPAILANWEAEIGRMAVQGQHGGKVPQLHLNQWLVWWCTPIIPSYEEKQK